jgi:GMP synthase (glutamine-hydrolysing)
MAPVLLLDCDLQPDGAAAFFLPLLPADTAVVRPPREALPAVDGWRAVVVTGSRASANDPDAWVDATAAWLAAAVAADVPVLGVCFGHQLLARALGATVFKRAAPEVGFPAVRIDPALAALPRTLTCFVSHEDEVAPHPALHVLAASDACAVHAYRHGRSLGVQFHLEYPPAEQQRILRFRAERHPELALDVDAALDTRDLAAALFAEFLAPG